MKESWQRAARRIVQMVELEDAEPVTVEMPSGKTQQYQVTRMEVTTFWDQGLEDQARQTVTFKVRKVFGDGRVSATEGKLYLQDFTHHGRQMPGWMEDIITRATPREVEVQ
jgi:hypothetical protein